MSELVNQMLPDAPQVPAGGVDPCHTLMEPICKIMTPPTGIVVCPVLSMVSVPVENVPSTFVVPKKCCPGMDESPSKR